MAYESGIPFDIWTICAHGDIQLLEQIMKGRSCKDIYKKNRQGWTPLMYACHNKHEEIVFMLVKSGVPLDDVNNEGQTALMHSCRSGNVNIVQLVFHRKIVDYVDREGHTALYYAIDFKQEDIVQFLLLQGADPNLLNNGITPLMQAAKIGNINIIDMLLMHDANRYIVNSDNEMAVDVAFKYGHVKVGYHLMEKQGVKSLQRFLHSIGLEQYWPLFQKFSISMSTFIKLNEDDFKALGIKLLGHRRRMSLAVAELKKQKKFEKVIYDRQIKFDHFACLPPKQFI